MRIASGKQAERIACVLDPEQDSMPPLCAVGYPDQEIRSLDEVDI
jgi:hypothetical protein